MNYPAYRYAEQGIHLDEALQLAQRALALDNAGHILDTSVGSISARSVQ
ncbi:MAG: hypothetical protein R2864_06310 [Syntrophotaleaceae bacterium]